MVVQERGGLNLINKVVIIPTGDEILNGTVVDTNSPAIMSIILEKFPACEVKRVRPVIDDEENIIESIEIALEKNPELIILIGGTGGGHRYIATLAKDYTHCALIKILPEIVFKELYGSNGHLWSKLVCGRKNQTLVVNVPGPYAEATEAVRVLIKCIFDGIMDINYIINEIAAAVKKQYGV